MYITGVLCAAAKCYKASNMCVLNPHVHVPGDDEMQSVCQSVCWAHRGALRKWLDRSVYFTGVLCAAAKCYKASNMCVLNPHVHVLGDDAAVIAYTTLTQHLDKLVMLHQL